MNCSHCGTEIIGDSFFCNDCGQIYCQLHQEPLIHECNIIRESLTSHQNQNPDLSYNEYSQVSVTHQEQEFSPTVVRGTTGGSYTWYRQDIHVPVDAFDPNSGIKFKGILLPHKSEFLHFMIASVLIFLIGFMIFYNEALISLGYGWTTFMLAGIYMTAFLFHEFGHRQVALHFKLQTKFRLLSFGMILTAFSLIVGLLKLIVGLLKIPFPSLALPGAVVVLGLEKMSNKTGLCKAAGPLVNLIYGIILFIISFLVPKSLYPLNYLFVVSAYLNFMLGAFNMIPLGILDGQNIWKWNKKVYVSLALALGTLLISTLIIQQII
ncbi:hypothetical protein LCGC14_1039650 [marine sediment metagenome]|uniref:Uncharacterized protein n=1 Tax=marine sediment metagenome TaxID=412755 RepID=A0A0F9MS58_9ZZZZ